MVHASQVAYSQGLKGFRILCEDKSPRLALFISDLEYSGFD